MCVPALALLGGEGVAKPACREGLCACLVLTSAHPSLLPASIVEFFFPQMFLWW